MRAIARFATLALLGVLVGCGSDQPPGNTPGGAAPAGPAAAQTPPGANNATAAARQAMRKTGKMDDAIDGFNTVLKMAEGKRDPSPPERLTSREAALRTEIAAMKQKPLEKPASEPEHPLFSAKKGDWAVYKHSDGRLERRRLTIQSSTCGMLAVSEPGGVSDVEVMYNKFYDPTLALPMDVRHRGLAIVNRLSEGDETVQIAGKSHETHWVEYKVVPYGGGDPYTLKVWFSKNVSLGVVKAEDDMGSDFMAPAATRAQQRRSMELVDHGTIENDPSRAAPKPPAPPRPVPPPAAPTPVSPPVAAEKGTPPEPAVPAQPKPATPAPVVTVYVLKDGRRINAVKVVEMDDEVSIKDDAGKFSVVKKSDIAEKLPGGN